jgi:NTE family protein
MTTRAPVAAAFGGGGMFGVGYGCGVADGLRDRGVDLTGAPLLGTSAGSWVASALVTGCSFDDLAARVSPRLPDPRPGVLAAAAARVFGDRRHPTVTAVACDLPLLRRVLLSGGRSRLADIVAASSAVPGLFAPQRIGRRWFVDGGVRSMVSADLAAAAELLVVVVPLAGPMFGPAGSRVTRRTAAETARWAAAHGGRVVTFTPTPELARHARRPDQLFDLHRARTAYEHGYAQATAAWAPDRLRPAPPVTPAGAGGTIIQRWPTRTGSDEPTFGPTPYGPAG